MTEVYRKFGRVVRLERGMRISVTEAGEAIETASTFIAAPIANSIELPEPALPLFDMPDSERLIVSSGIAVHQFDDIEWREETRRLHVALTHGRFRAIVDLDDFDFALIEQIKERLAQIGDEREPPPRICIAPHVAAALLPRFVGVFDIWQQAGGRDGKGEVIVEGPAREAKSWYRPSYRVRPIRRPLNLAARAARKEVDPELPRAIALLDGGKLLIDDGRDVYLAPLRIVSIDAAAPDGELESRC
jgi:hypothetical protein